MKRRACARVAALGGALLGISACAGLGPPAAPRATIDAGPSQMNSTANAQNLLYVSDDGANAVYVYGYPGGALVGRLTNLTQPAGLCTDATGDVWVVQSGLSRVTEYAHGGKTPLTTLIVTGAKSLLSCSVDSTTGDLAVTDLGDSTGGGGVWLYAGAHGTPRHYTTSNVKFAYFDGYDMGGNLFVDGLDRNYTFEFAELPKGASMLKSIIVHGRIEFPGGVRWDGAYIAIGDQRYKGGHTSAIDRISVSGSTAKIRGTTSLDASCDVIQFAFARTGANKQGEKNQVIAPDACQNRVAFYKYPAGGAATKSLKGLQYPVAATLSLVK